ncbi:MAG: hypothetical protein ACRDZO_00380 [Egibacteraceae bacterium]
MARFEFVALTLLGLADPLVAIAANRADAVGVLGISFVCDEQRSARAVTRPS